IPSLPNFSSVPATTAVSLVARRKVSGSQHSRAIESLPPHISTWALKSAGNTVQRTIESLESRKLLSGIVFNAEDDTITVTGTSDSDVVMALPAPGGQMTLILNGQSQTFLTDDFTLTSFDLLGGDDILSIDALAPSYFSVDA